MTVAQNSAVGQALTALQSIEQEMCAQLIQRDEVVRLALVGVLAREHLVILGPPGTSKSMLVDLLARRVAAPQGGMRLFEHLMMRQTTPEEIFGPISVAGLKRDEYRRNISGMLPEAEFAFLDEIFKANSAILNGLLKILNERTYKNGTAVLDVPLISLVGASNEMPQGDDLGALWDRFILRTTVNYVDDSGFNKLLRLAFSAAPPTTIALSDLQALQAAVQTVTIPDSTIEMIVQLRRDLAAESVVASDRRWRKALPILQAHALIDGRTAVEEDDLTILANVLWQAPEQRAAIARAAGRIANPLNARALELADQASEVYRVARDKGADSSLDDQGQMGALLEGTGKLRKMVGELKKLHDNAGAQGRSTARIDKERNRIRQMLSELAEDMVSRDV